MLNKIKIKEEIPTFLKKLVFSIKNRNKKIDKNNFIKFALSPIVKLIKIIMTESNKIIGLEHFLFIKKAKISKLIKWKKPPTTSSSPKKLAILPGIKE